jgi:Immunity protein 8
MVDDPATRSTLMQAEIVHISMMSELKFADFRPDDPSSFGTRLTVLCRPLGSIDASDAFELLVCTPTWLATQFRPGPRATPPGYPPYWSVDGEVMFGTGLLFVEQWSAQTVLKAIESLVASAKGPDWGAVASRLGRMMPWEYDYPGPAFPAK